MFCINKDEELTVELLQKMINRFNVEVAPRLQRYKNYYDGNHAIVNKSYTDASKPCNKTVINYAANIVNQYVGYMSSPNHISYSSTEDIEPIMDILRYNDYQTQDSDLMLDAFIYGVSAELMFNDMAGKTRFRRISPLNCFGVFDDSLTGDLLYFVRMYKANDWDNSDLYKVDVYMDYIVKHYEMSGMGGYLKYIGEEFHYFNQCPATIVMLPDEKSIFDCIISIQDGINEIVSCEIEEFQQFADAYLTLSGCDADNDDIVKMKEERVLVLPPDATAQWLTKTANDTQTENILKRLHDSIYRISQCIDMTSESFTGGVSSGIAIRYKMCGQENRAAKIEAIFKKALQRRVEIICGIAALKLGEEVFRDIKIEFKRNIPEDYTAIINVVNALKGTVSDKTLLGLLPFVNDVNAELEALQAQKQANMAMYSFGAHTDEEEEEEE